MTEYHPLSPSTLLLTCEPHGWAKAGYSTQEHWWILNIFCGSVAAESSNVGVWGYLGYVGTLIVALEPWQEVRANFALPGLWPVVSTLCIHLLCSHCGTRLPSFGYILQSDFNAQMENPTLRRPSLDKLWGYMRFCFLSLLLYLWRHCCLTTCF